MKIMLRKIAGLFREKIPCTEREGFKNRGLLYLHGEISKFCEGHLPGKMLKK